MTAECVVVLCRVRGGGRLFSASASEFHCNNGAVWNPAQGLVGLRFMRRCS